MSLKFDPTLLKTVHQSMHRLATQLRLPFRRIVWRGTGGNWLGAGIGSSIDFQDHRPYQYGDDLRYLDWNAYARTGNYIMKLFREEVSPAVDIAFDVSPSMFLDEQKQIRSLELLYFALESVLQAEASLRVFFVRGDSVRRVEKAELLRYDFSFPTDDGLNEIPAVHRIAWRSGSMRVFISDLLYRAAPETLLIPLRVQKGRALLFVPYSEQEENPGWDGNIRFEDCESPVIEERLVDDEVMQHYLQSYQRHFDQWKEFCVKTGIPFARIAADVSLEQVLLHQALPEGAVETWT